MICNFRKSKGRWRFIKAVNRRRTKWSWKWFEIHEKLKFCFTKFFRQYFSILLRLHMNKINCNSSSYHKFIINKHSIFVKHLPTWTWMSNYRNPSIIAPALLMRSRPTNKRLFRPPSTDDSLDGALLIICVRLRYWFNYLTNCRVIYNSRVNRPQHFSDSFSKTFLSPLASSFYPLSSLIEGHLISFCANAKLCI